MKLRLMTANLWSGATDPASLAAVLEAAQPDVLALQELGQEQAEVIAAALPYGTLEPRDDFDGMGLALRHPAGVTSLALPQRNARIARLEPGVWPGLGLAVEIVNVHILAPHALPPWRTWPTRSGQVRRLTRWLDANPHPTRIVCGDFNATPLWPAYRRLAGRIPDVIAAHARAEGKRPVRTWGPGHGAPRLLRIDHVLANAGRVLEVRTLTIGGSDHSAVVVDFEL